MSLSTPAWGDLSTIVDLLASWQSDGAAFQLHPGDLGWFWSRGAEATARALRIWSRDGAIAGIGLLDGPDTLRLTTAPELRRDTELAERIAGDLMGDGVFAPGPAVVEAPVDAVLHDVLQAHGWVWDAPWTPLQRDLAVAVPAVALRVEIVDSATAAAWSQTLRGSFEGSRFDEQRWRMMASGVPFTRARSLLGSTAQGPVAVVTIWSAGAGRPGLIEPMGVPSAHRGHGYGRAITLAAAAALQAMGASSAVVATPSANVAGVATYAAAGYRPLPQRRDQARPLLAG